MFPPASLANTIFELYFNIAYEAEPRQANSNIPTYSARQGNQPVGVACLSGRTT